MEMASRASKELAEALSNGAEKEYRLIALSLSYVMFEAAWQYSGITLSPEEKRQQITSRLPGMIRSVIQQTGRAAGASLSLNAEVLDQEANDCLALHEKVLASLGFEFWSLSSEEWNKVAREI
jgi:hypothetical protein